MISMKISLLPNMMCTVNEILFLQIINLFAHLDDKATLGVLYVSANHKCRPTAENKQNFNMFARIFLLISGIINMQ